MTSSGDLILVVLDPTPAVTGRSEPGSHTTPRPPAGYATPAIPPASHTVSPLAAPRWPRRAAPALAPADARTAS